MIKMRKKMKGFTLIELVVVMVIIGILAVVAIPKFQDLTLQANAAATKNGLAALRSEVSILYASNNGAFPATINATDMATGVLPDNKLAGSNVVVPKTADPSGQSDLNATTMGWWYNTTNGKFYASAGSSAQPTFGW